MPRSVSPVAGLVKLWSQETVTKPWLGYASSMSFVQRAHPPPSLRLCVPAACSAVVSSRLTYLRVVKIVVAHHRAR